LDEALINYGLRASMPALEGSQIADSRVNGSVDNGAPRLLASW
jgi:hypothetical protein